MKHRLITFAALLFLAFGAQAQTTDTIVYGHPYEWEPEFPGGLEALVEFFSDNICYPLEAQDYHIEGKLYATFVVDSLGFVRNPRIILGLPGGCNQAVLDAIRRMPRWEPGRQHSGDKWVPVDYQYSLPVNFNLEKDTTSLHRSRPVVDDTLLPSYPGGTGALYRYLAGAIDRPREEWGELQTPQIQLDSLGHVTSVTRLGASPMDSAIHQALLHMPRWHMTKDYPKILLRIPIDLPLLLSMRDTLLRPYTMRCTRWDDDLWATLLHHEPYFRALLAVDDSLAAGFHVPAQRLQALMPHDRETFLVLFSLEDYVTSTYFPVIYDTLAALARADSLDMMDRFLALLQWSDGWVSEFVLDHALAIEKQHPRKFRSVMRRYKNEWEFYKDFKKELEEFKNGKQ